MTDPATTDLPHEEAAGLLDALHDGELDEAEAARVRAHLASCERCRKLEALLGGGLREAVSSLPADTQAEQVLPGVQRKIRLRSRGRFYGERAKAPSPWPLLLGSVVVLGILIASYVLIGQVAGTSNAPPASSSAPSGR